jgi:hypothetical protein
VREARFTATNFSAFRLKYQRGPPAVLAFGSVAPTFRGRKAVAGAPMCEQEIGQMRA